MGVATAPEIPQLSNPSMEPELAIVVVETGKVKKEITKATLARTQQTSAKKKPAKKKPAKKKAAKKPKKKKAKKKKAKKKKKKKKKKAKKKQKKKKKKKKKKKVVKYPGGKRPKGVHKSKASIAAGKKIAAAQKKKGVGLFATKTLSADLAAICGKNKMSRPDMTKALWAYIKKNSLSKGRTITPDAKLKKVLPAASLSMFKMPTMLKKHIK